MIAYSFGTPPRLREEYDKALGTAERVQTKEKETVNALDSLKQRAEEVLEARSPSSSLFGSLLSRYPQAPASQRTGRHLLEDDTHKARFVQEAKAAAALDHPNICTIHEIDEAEGQAFLAMAYLDGSTVSQKIKERPLKLDEALDIALQAAGDAPGQHYPSR